MGWSFGKAPLGAVDQDPAASPAWAGSGKGCNGQEWGGLQGEWCGMSVGCENPDPGVDSHFGIGLGLSWMSPPRAGDVQQQQWVPGLDKGSL